MILLFNAFTLTMCILWNASMVIGTIWLIEDANWSPWTLVVTLFFFCSWKPYNLQKAEPEAEPEKSKIILDEKLPS